MIWPLSLVASVLQPVLQPLLIGTVVASTVLAGVQTWRLHSLQTEYAQAQARHAQATAAAHEVARAETERLLALTTKRVERVQEIARETDQRLARARADAVAAHTAGERLCERIAALTAAGDCPAAPATPIAPTGEAAPTTANLLSDVQRRLDEAADGIAGFADAAHAAGLACEAAYDALRR